MKSCRNRLDPGRDRAGTAWIRAVAAADPDRAGLARRINDRGRLTGSFRLRSGVTSGEYFDKYLLEADPLILRDVAVALSRLLPDGVDAVAGLELGGVPLATVVSHVTGLPARFVRKQAKTYGTCRLAEGGEIAACGSP
ncbi:MAG TPA: hypothetical protein VIJ51_09770 [Solirubrobacteraceae bacterium]